MKIEIQGVSKSNLLSLGVLVSSLSERLFKVTSRKKGKIADGGGRCKLEAIHNKKCSYEDLNFGNCVDGAMPPSSQLKLLHQRLQEKGESEGWIASFQCKLKTETGGEVPKRELI